MTILLNRIAVVFVFIGILVASFNVGAQTPANTLVIANRIDDLVTLDPAESFEFDGSDVIRNVYGNLVNFDPMNLDQGYMPELAESWVVSDDGRSITFTMREGIKFHSGNPVRAEDAEFSLRRAVLLNKTPAFILTQFGFTKDNISQTIKADGNTLTITTDKRYATSFVLNCLTSSISAIVDKELVLANQVEGDLGNNWLKTNSAGSGAYKLVGWKPNESVVLSSNPEFYGGAPAIERVIVRHVQESATQRLLLERGDIDVARSLTPEDIAAVSQTDGLTVDDELRGRLLFFAINQKNPVLAKPKVRQALKYLVDYEGMQNSFLKGQYSIHQNFLPQTYLGAVNENPFSLNVEKAKKLLDEAGVKNLEIEIGVSEDRSRIEIAQSLQNTFGQAGIKVNIKTGISKQVSVRHRARELDFYLGSWGPDYPDPHTNAGTFAYNLNNTDEAKATGSMAWRSAWDTDGLTAKVEQAVVEPDQEVRAKMYRDIQAEFREKAPFTILFQQTEQTARKENVKNLVLGGAITAISYWPVVKE